MRRNPIRPPRRRSSSTAAVPTAQADAAPTVPTVPTVPHRVMATDAEARYRSRHLDSPKLRPAYAHLLELGARGSGPEHARFMVHEIQRLIDRRGWTDSEASMLHAARTKWERRRDGKDARYLFTGSNKPGRLPKAVQAEIRTYQTMLDLAEGASAALDDYQLLYRSPSAPPDPPQEPHGES